MGYHPTPVLATSLLRYFAATRRRRTRLLAHRFTVEIRDEPYQDHLLARLYQPKGVVSRAALVDVHGGNWTGGDRFQQAMLDRDLAANGLLVVAVEYRLAPPHAYPAAVEDVTSAARWLRDRAAHFGAAPAAR